MLQSIFKVSIGHFRKTASMAYQSSQKPRTTLGLLPFIFRLKTLEKGQVKRKGPLQDHKANILIPNSLAHQVQGETWQLWELSTLSVGGPGAHNILTHMCISTPTEAPKSIGLNCHGVGVGEEEWKIVFTEHLFWPLLLLGAWYPVYHLILFVAWLSFSFVRILQIG